LYLHDVAYSQREQACREISLKSIDCGGARIFNGRTEPPALYAGYANIFRIEFVEKCSLAAPSGEATCFTNGILLEIDRLSNAAFFAAASAVQIPEP
jgi:hypothetical protein